MEDPGVGVGRSSFGDIRIAVAAIDGASKVLGQTIEPTATNSGGLVGDIVLDKDEPWNEHAFFLVVAHEIGHALGLDHETVATALMNPYYNNALTGLQADDIAGIRTIYGAQDNAATTYTLKSDRADITLLQGTDNLTLVGNALANTIEASSKAETIRGASGDDTISGGGGDDTIYGDFVSEAGAIRIGAGSYQRTFADENTSKGSAVDLSASFAVVQSADVYQSSTVPHVTVRGTGDGSIHYYAVDIGVAGSKIVIDVDSPELVFDSYLVLYGPDGSIVASNYDASMSLGGTGSFISYDAYIELTTSVAGRYVFGIGSSLDTGLGAVPSGAGYTVHLSVDGELQYLNGNDSLAGDAGNDALYGGAGDDTLAGGAGADKLDGGLGNDWASYAASTTGISVSLADPAAGTGDAQGDTFSSIEGVLGTDYADVIVGNVGDNTLEGGSGADTLSGGSGNDAASYAHAQAGVTASLETGGLSGEAKGDVYVSIENLIGSGSDDVLTGDGGGNRIEGGAGSDTLTGGDGSDTLVGGAGGNDLVGGLGLDTVSYAAAARAVTASLSDNTGSSGLDTFDDYISIEALAGSAFADVLTGNDGANTLSGNGGGDTLAGGSGADSLSGGAGGDWASYAGAGGGVVLALTSGGTSGDAAGDTFVSIENVLGTAYADSITGDGRFNRIVGGAGSDTLSGNGGDDTLVGGAGADSFDGGAGTDLVTYADATAGVTVAIAGPATTGSDEGAGDRFSSVEKLIGSSYDDTILLAALPSSIDGGKGSDTISFAPASAGLDLNLEADDLTGTSPLTGIEQLLGSALADKITGNGIVTRISGGGGNDTISGGDGSDTLDGGDGIDTLSYGNASSGIVVSLSSGTPSSGGAAGDVVSAFENVDGTISDDAITGDSGANDLFGNQGADTLVGGGGNDTLRGGSLSDSLTGGEGNDRLDGGTGVDTLSGGTGSDTYVIDDNGDVISETADGGADFVWSATLSLDLKSLANIENLGLLGTLGLSLAGDDGANVLTGNAGDNVIQGRGGNDTMTGGDGTDTAVYAGTRSDFAVTYDAATSTYTVRDLRATSLTGVDLIKGVEVLAFSDGSFAPVQCLNRAPAGAATATLAAGKEDVAYIVSRDVLLQGFLDPDGHALSLKLLTASEGTVTDNGDGTYTIDPEQDYNGPVKLTYAVTDGVATLYGQTRTFTLEAANDAPRALSISNLIVNENAATGALVGTLSAFDPDIADALTYALVDNGGGRFALQGTKLVVADGTLLDYEQGGSHAVTVRVTDSAGASFQSTINVALNDVASETATGNAVANLLLGGEGADSFAGVGGNDTLKGQGGNDTLIGGEGNDLLQGGLGADSLSGGNGTDTASYGGSAAGVSVDLMTGKGTGGEAAGDLLSGMENLLGSAFADTLSGSTGANTLTGYGGNDSLFGSEGNDVLIGGAGADSLSGGNGIDTASYAASAAAVTIGLITGKGAGGEAAGDVLSSIESLTGSQFGDVLTGNAAANALLGGAGADTLNGGAGADTLTGGAGADVYVFSTAPGPGNIDTITDFIAADDTVRLENGVMPGLISTGVLAGSAFVIAATAADGQDRIVYNAVTGALYYDVDGAGGVAQVQIAKLSPGLALTAADFVVI